MTAKKVSCRFEASTPFYGPFSIQKWPFLGCFRDNCHDDIWFVQSTLLFLHND